MFDGSRVILDAFNRMIKKKPDTFKNNFKRGEIYNNGTKGIDCRRMSAPPFEHGEKISRFLKKVCKMD